MITQLALQKWNEILLTLYNIQGSYRYCQKVYREIPVAGSHVRSIISLFEANGFISREKKGRIKHISFTAKGKQIAEDVLKLKQDLNSPLSAFRNSL